MITIPRRDAMNIWNQLTAILGPTADLCHNVYQKLISRNAGRGQIQATFAQAVPVLVDDYNRSIC